MSLQVTKDTSPPWAGEAFFLDRPGRRSEIAREAQEACKEMLDKSSKRRPWSDEGKRQLIEYWDSVRSTVLISLMLDRSPSSIQTQASRLGLPRRSEASDRHRRRWTRRDGEDREDRKSGGWGKSG